LAAVSRLVDIINVSYEFRQCFSGVTSAIVESLEDEYEHKLSVCTMMSRYQRFRAAARKDARYTSSEKGRKLKRKKAENA
jgi:hypothetical protein